MNAAGFLSDVGISGHAIAHVSLQQVGQFANGAKGQNVVTIVIMLVCIWLYVSLKALPKSNIVSDCIS